MGPKLHAKTLRHLEQLSIDPPPILNRQVVQVFEIGSLTDKFLQKPSKFAEKWLPEGIFFDMISRQVIFRSANRLFDIEDVHVLTFGHQLG